MTLQTQVPEVNVEEIMRKIREEVARRKQETPMKTVSIQPIVNSNLPPLNIPERISIPRVRGEMPFTYKETYNLVDFLNYHDEEFIRYAYSGILNRTPDDSGLQHYLSGLRTGVLSKIDILGRLRYSQEGRQKATPVQGLFLPFLFYSTYRVPVVGYFLRIFMGILRFPTLIHNIQTLESYTTLHLQEKNRLLNQTAEAVEQGFSQFGASFREFVQQFQVVAQENVNHAHHLENILAGKAELSAITEIRGALQGNVHKLDQLRTELQQALQQSKAKLLEQIQKIKQEKADTSVLNQTRQQFEQILARKVDTGVLDQTRQTLEEFIQAITDENTLIDEKIKAELIERKLEVQRLQETLDSKADTSVLDQTRQQFEQILAGKVDTGVLDQTRQTLEEFIQAIADENTLITAKIKSEFLERKLEVQQIKQMLAAKVDEKQVNNFIAQKADKSTVEQISQKIEQTATELKQKFGELVQVTEEEYLLIEAQTKADFLQNKIEIQGVIEKMLSSKVDAESLAKLREQIENILKDKIDNAQLAQKFEEFAQTATEENTLIGSRLKTDLLQNKLEMQELMQKMLASKIDVQLWTEIQKAIEAKADSKSLVDLRDQIDGILKNKVDSQTLSDMRIWLQEMLETRTDSTEFDLIGSKIKAELLQSKLELQDLVQKKADIALFNQTQEQLKGINQQVLTHKRNIVAQEQRLSLLLEEARKRLPEPLDTDQIQTMVKEEDHLLDAMYVAFEDQFRGTREDIKERLKVYLPYIKQAKAGTQRAPILDVGCGRGEWLELLQENGKVARGIDVNRIMVKECVERELDVVEANVVEYLRQQKQGSLGAVTGFHIIEHLGLKKLVALFDEALRVLRPGGIVIFETPNPENLLVGSCYFYTDPTHKVPLVPQSLSYIFEQRGFSKTEILKLHKRAEPKYTENDHINELIWRSNMEQDYAIIGYKA